MDLTKKTIPSQLERIEAACHKDDYAGFCKFDALNSPLLEKLLGRFERARRITSDVVDFLPLSARAWLGVPKRRSPRDIASFVRAYAALYRADRNPTWRDRAIQLADWLLRQESHEMNAYQGVGRGWGEHFPQQLGEIFVPRFAPNAMASALVGEAMLSVFEITGKRKYLEAAFGVRDYLLKVLPVLLENEYEKCVGYVGSGLKWRVIGANAVAAGFLARLAVRTADRELPNSARKMIQWVCDRRNWDYTWDYTSPKEQSHSGPDQHLTGAILEGIHNYMSLTGDTRFMNIYSKALDEYVVKERSEYGSAQAFIAFAQAARLNPKYQVVADRLEKWTLEREELAKVSCRERSVMLRALAESTLARQVSENRALSTVPAPELREAA